jgi:hypothetical protein
MATSTATITEEMKKMMSIFSVNKSNYFNEINMHLTKLDIRLIDIECQCCPNAHEATTKELKEDTKRVMEDVGHAFLKSKQEAPTTTTPPELVDVVAKQLVHHSFPIYRATEEHHRHHY